jgi:hypothetical protein
MILSIRFDALGEDEEAGSARNEEETGLDLG